MAHVLFARALAAHIARRFVRIATIMALVFMTVLLLLTYALAYFSSPWWWLLLIPISLFVAIVFVVRLSLSFIIRRMYPRQLSPEQSGQLDLFVDKIQSLLEARSTPFPFIVLLCIKDLLLHRDLVTIRSIINDSTGLTHDYRKLEKLFN
jgi:hypothetical protein